MAINLALNYSSFSVPLFASNITNRSRKCKGRRVERRTTNLFDGYAEAMNAFGEAKGRRNIVALDFPPMVM
jgi:hypothetical protein